VTSATRSAVVLALAACGANSTGAPASPNTAGPDPAHVQALATSPAAPPSAARPWVGVQVGADNHVEMLVPNAPAERGGVKAGDLLVSLDGVGLVAPSDLSTRVRGDKVGQRVVLRVRRAGAELDLPLTLAPRKELAQLRGELIDHPAPDFAPEPVGNAVGPVKLSELAGHVAIIDFWATWCPPCRAAVPHLEQLHAKYPDLRVVGVSTEDATDLREFAAAEQVHYPVARDADGEMWRHYLADAIPMLVVIDRHGTVRDITIGLTDPGGLDREVAALLLKK
jgi:thiol-disulfide isomerase/thioredoxin